MDLKERTLAAMNDAAIELRKMQENAKVTREGLKIEILTQIISDCKDLNGLPESASINEGSINNG
jgi:hypothetical protein